MYRVEKQNGRVPGTTVFAIVDVNDNVLAFEYTPDAAQIRVNGMNAMEQVLNELRVAITVNPAK